LNRFSKRTVFAIGAPLALATVLGGSAAFAASQSGSETPVGSFATSNQQAPTPAPTSPAPTSPTTPGTPGRPKNHDSANCPNMGGSGSNGSSTQGSGTQQSTSMRMMRPQRSSSAVY
jgi:hypothetical protein